jgi:hypothetical protein
MQMPSKIVDQLIEEVAGIKADLIWIKKAIWTLAGAGVTFNVTLAISLVMYFLKK